MPEDLAMFADDCAAVNDHRLLRLAAKYFNLRHDALLARSAGRIEEATNLEANAEEVLAAMRHEG